MGYDVQIEIERGRTGGTFTNHDLVTGVVKLTTTSALNLSYISVKLEGVAETRLVISKEGASQNQKRKNDRKDKFRQDTHKVLYDSVIVFPPENVRQVSQSKGFTLVPGTYTYGFQFKIPLYNSCKKLTGISNKVQFSKNSFDLVINNGNFNGRTLVNSANNYFQGPGYSSQGNLGSPQTQDYHIDAQLPPSLPDMNGMANIKYFVKATCSRPSILKANLRAFDPFVFLPLDLKPQAGVYREGQQFEDYSERFFRKDLIFRGRSPEGFGVRVPHTPVNQEPKSRGLLGSLFGNRSSRNMQPRSGNGVTSFDVSFAFEMRMPHPPTLSPNSTPNFTLYLVSDTDPVNYSMAKHRQPEKSNGLGVMYLQSLVFELKAATLISVLDNDGNITQIHQSRIEETIPLCSNTYQNLKFDLMNCRRQKSSTSTSSGFGGSHTFELEIPAKYYENFCLPRNLPPTFRTCNIARGYGLSVVAGISSEKIFEVGSIRETEEKIQYVDIFCPDMRVLSGLKLTSNLHSNASGTSLGLASDTKKGSLGSGYPPDHKAPLSEKNSLHSSPQMTGEGPESTLPSSTVGSNGASDVAFSLPTYDDVVRENSYQDDSEHQRARQRYGR